MPKPVSIRERLDRCEAEIDIAETMLKHEPPITDHRKHGEWFRHTSSTLHAAIQEGLAAKRRAQRETGEGVVEIAKLNEQADRLQKRIDQVWAQLQTRRIAHQKEGKVKL